MKGHVYYSQVESYRNQAFIEDLVKEAKRVKIDLTLLIEGDQPGSDADFILFRDRNSELAKKFEMDGFTLLNRAEVNRIANDKLMTFELATVLGVPAVPTKRIHAFTEILVYPCVLKTVDGHGGNEVFLCTSEAKAKVFFRQFESHKLIVQPFIESGAQDVRVFMLGDEVLGAVKRTGNGSFKSNYTLGGTAEIYLLNALQAQDAITIAKAVKSDYIGIDFLLLPDGRWLLNEIEDPVGARSLYATHDFSVAEKLMGFVLKKIFGG